MTDCLKILFIAANPADTIRLEQDDEFRGIEEAIDLARLKERVELIPTVAARPRDVQPHLLRANPHVVHVTGHGTEGGGVALVGHGGKTAPENAAAWKG